MTVTADRARRASGLVLSIALALSQGAIAQSPPATARDAGLVWHGIRFPRRQRQWPPRRVSHRRRAGPARYQRPLRHLRPRSCARDNRAGQRDARRRGRQRQQSSPVDQRRWAFRGVLVIGEQSRRRRHERCRRHLRARSRLGAKTASSMSPTGTILTRVSLDTDGIEANCASARPSISANGRYVAFDSCVTNWAVVGWQEAWPSRHLRPRPGAVRHGLGQPADAEFAQRLQQPSQRRRLDQRRWPLRRVRVAGDDAAADARPLRVVTHLRARYVRRRAG